MKAWRQPNLTDSLPESHSTVRIPHNGGFWRTLGAYAGPGLLVAVGYMDPGNWATDIAGGSQFGYKLLSVILISNLFAMLLQHLSLRLGVATGRDLAQACRDSYSRPVSLLLWVLAEIAIAATDLAEVIGSAIALNLLFGMPLPLGVALTVLDVFLLLFLQKKGFRVIESIVGVLILIILVGFGYELLLAQPDVRALLGGLVPRTEVVTTPGMLYLAIGILGATVMPHNLYLHSSIVQTRNFARTDKGRTQAIRFATIDSTASLLLAFFINAAILILAASTFHFSGNQQVADINDAYKLLDPLLGTTAASIVFGVALLASGQSSTLTGTIAGQIVMEGFINLKLKPWVRRLVTRLVAVIPAMIVAIIYGERGTAELLVLSQVILSLQLSFAVVPLVLFTSDRLKMGRFVNPRWITITAWVVAVIIIALNGYLLWNTVKWIF